MRLVLIKELIEPPTIGTLINLALNPEFTRNHSPQEALYIYN